MIPVTIDFLMTVKSNGWSSDQLKYKDLAKDANFLVDMLDDLDEDLEIVSFVFGVTMTYEQTMRFFKLLTKGMNHVTYHLGRKPSRPSAYEHAHRRDGQKLIFSDLCTIEDAAWDGDKPAAIKIVFGDVLKIQNQNLRGATIVANLIRMANAIAWILAHNVKLSPKPITMKTWNTITIWGENPWMKKTDEASMPHPASPEEEEESDLYNEE